MKTKGQSRCFSHPGKLKKKRNRREKRSMCFELKSSPFFSSFFFPAATHWLFIFFSRLREKMVNATRTTESHTPTHSTLLRHLSLSLYLYALTPFFSLSLSLFFFLYTTCNNENHYIVNLEFTRKSAVAKALV